MSSLTLVLGNRPTVEEARLPAGGPQERRQDERALEIVAPLGSVVGVDGDGAGAAVLAQEPSEAASAVEARHAVPVDRPCARDERRGVAIAD